MQTNNLDSECITICFRDELGFHPNATRISIISAVAVCPQMYFSMSDSFAGPLGLLGFNDKEKKCVDYFKRRRRKRRSEMTKMPLAINRWSELSYYLETQTDVRFSREANVSVFHDDSRKPVRKGNERKTWWCVTYSISGISLIGWVFAVFHGGGIFIKLAAADLSFNLTFVMITHVNFTVLGFPVCLFSHIACSLIRAFIDSQDNK